MTHDDRRNEEPQVDAPTRIPLGFYRPSKSFGEMSEPERRAFAKAVSAAMLARYDAAKTAVDSGQATADEDDAPGRGGSEGETMSDKMRGCYHIVDRLEQWARIRTEAGEDATIGGGGGASMRKSRLLYRLLMDDKDPLPLPPPRAWAGPWYSVIERRGAVISRDMVSIRDEDASIENGGSWHVLETLIEGGSHVVTCPGRAIGRWSLVLYGEGHEAKWRLARVSVGPGGEWDHHVAHVERRLKRFFSDTRRQEFVIVDVEGGGKGYVQVCTVDGDTALRYEAAGEENVDEPAVAGVGLGDRLHALAFDDPDEGAEGNYHRDVPAPVDLRALAEDMLVVMAEAYGMKPDDRIVVESAVGRATRS